MRSVHFFRRFGHHLETIHHLVELAVFQEDGIFTIIKDTLKKRSFEVEGRQHPLFNSLAGNKIDNLDILFLTDTINTGNTLFENGRIPRQIEIDKYRRNLQIQPCTSGIS